MPNQDITRQFRKFGFKIIPIGFMAILFLLFIIINFFVYFQPTLFWPIITIVFQLIITWPIIVAAIFQIIIYFIFLIILGNFKKAAHLLNNYELIRTHSKMIVVSIMRIIGYTLFIISIFILMSITEIDLNTIIAFVIGFMLRGCSVILIFIAAILDIQVWKTIKSELSNIIKIKNAKSGANFCMMGAIFYIIPYFWFVSEIIKIIGYFKLSNLRNLKEDDIIITLPPSPQHMQILPTPLKNPNKKFCAKCGAPLKGTENYCTSCGSKI